MIPSKMLNLKTPCGENHVFNVVYISFWFVNMLKDKPHENSSVNTIAEHFLLKLQCTKDAV